MATKKRVPKPKAARKVLRPLLRTSAPADRTGQVKERALSFDEAVLVAKPGMRLLLDFGRGPFYYTIEGNVRPEGRRALLDRLLEMEFERPAWAPQHSKTFG
jgi:hypothetical protein